MCITFVQRRPSIVQMLYKCFVFTGMTVGDPCEPTNSADTAVIAVNLFCDRFDSCKSCTCSF